METIGTNVVWSLFDDDAKPRRAKNGEVRGGPGHTVGSYATLARRIAQLQFMNPQYVQLFRGQNRDHANRSGNTALKPSLLRSARGNVTPPSLLTLVARFRALRLAEAELVRTFEMRELPGREKLARHRILRWAILQHYGICDTPLLDVSQSLRIAASFASEGAQGEAFVYVLAVPNISGVVTASAEAGVQCVRLSGICPPEAVRPHIQEGYLLGEYPDMPDLEQKERYAPYEIDFGRRLIGKFRLDLATFWNDVNFPRVAHAALYPDGDDPLFTIMQEIGAKLESSRFRNATT